MNSNDARVIRTYSQLINGMISLLKTKSFDDLSVSEICDVSDVHRATFYKHFNDKYEFLNFCFESQLKSISFENINAGTTPKTIKTNIIHFVKCVLQFIDENRELFNSACIKNSSLSFNSSFDNAINKFCAEKLNAVLNAPSHRIDLSSAFYSSAFVGMVRWYINVDDEKMMPDVMDFIEHRVDELCVFYEKYFFTSDYTLS